MFVFFSSEVRRFLRKAAAVPSVEASEADRKPMDLASRWDRLGIAPKDEFSDSTTLGIAQRSLGVTKKIGEDLNFGVPC